MSENKKGNTTAKERQVRRPVEDRDPSKKDQTLRIDSATYERVKDVMHTLRLDSIRDATRVIIERGLQAMEEELYARKEEEIERFIRERAEREQDILRERSKV